MSEITGSVYHVGTTEQATEKLTKRELIVKDESNEKYPQLIKIEAINDRCKLFDGLQVGQNVTVHFNLNGREWINPKGVKQYFNSLMAWKVEAGSVSSPEYVAPVDISNAADDDDLPF